MSLVTLLGAALAITGTILALSSQGLMNWGLSLLLLGVIAFPVITPEIARLLVGRE